MGQVAQKQSIASAKGVAVAISVEMIRERLRFGRHVAEVNATNHSLVRAYVWGLDLSETLDGAGGVGGLLWVRVGSGPAVGTHFVCYDGNGNVWNLVSATTGTETARYEYGPFGEPLRLSGPAARLNPFRFSTKRTEDLTGLVLYEYRAYSPSSGRWLSRDPIEEGGGLGLFVFIVNAPVRSADSLGLQMAPPGWPWPTDPGRPFPPAPPGTGTDICDWLRRKGREYLKSPQEIDAWERYTSGSGGTRELTCREMQSVLHHATNVRQELERRMRECTYGGRHWMGRRETLVDVVGGPWELALGHVVFELTTACECGVFHYELCLDDTYDFDPKPLGSRERDAEVKTRIVWLITYSGLCNWVPFDYTGCYGRACSP